MTVNRINVVVTGVGWMGSGVGSIESAMAQLFENAKFEILITVYTISSEVDLLFRWIEEALSRGVEITIVINQFDKQPLPAIHYLSDLASKYVHLHLYKFATTGTDLHSKIVIVDRAMAMVGSSNLSLRGFLNNYELALVIDGPVVDTLANVFDRLISVPYITRV